MRLLESCVEARRTVETDAKGAPVERYNGVAMSTTQTRREFLFAGVAAGIAFSGAGEMLARPIAPSGRKFYAILSLGRLGFQASFPESVELATKHGFEGLDPDISYFASLRDDALRRLLDELQERKLKFGAAGLPVEFRKDAETFNADLKKLPAAGDVLENAGIRRVNTWIMPCSDELTYLQNFRQHTERLRLCAQVLADHNQKLGLEYVSPRTLWRSQKHPFIHTMSEMKELLAAIGTNNLGIQLDSWHWFNAQETAQDVATLRGQDVITVDLNDAPAGLTLDQYRDNSRELPAATGVIPVKQFLDALLQIEYDGPIQAEPFNAALRALPIDQACAAASTAMKKAFGLM
ncbi:MAG TPA: TIM barrel protein [Candidatus Sulfotelmatobacter sp.]|nr:TIM barrel protein [Candidatus Sulfotelmatobacter sp.]